MDKINASPDLIKQKINEQGFKELCSLIAKIDDPNLLEDFFVCLFTAAERRNMAKRWLLVQEINKGATQREIAQMFQMSLCKITRGSRELKKTNSAFRRVLEMWENSADTPL